MENKLLTPMPLSPFTKTVGATGVSATQITVEDIAAFPVPNAGEEGVAILCAVKEFYSNDPSDFETITYTGITGSTLTGVTRAVEGTAKSWVAGTTIACMFVAEYIKRINKELAIKWSYDEDVIKNVKVNNAVNSDTVNGKTVDSNVPANAKFTDTIYTHPTTAGNKHIPSGGVIGQVLKNIASGTATWQDELDNDTITTINGKTGEITKEDIVALGIPAQDTVVDVSGLTSNIDFEAHKAETMPHRFTDGGKIYRWGFRTVNGQPQFIYEEVVS